MSRGLKDRVLTSATLAVPTVAVVVWGETWGVAILFGGFMALGAMEWIQLATGERRGTPVVFPAILVASAAALYWAGPRTTVATIVNIAGCVWWCAGIAWLVRYQLSAWVPAPSRAILLSIGWLVLLSAWIAIVALHDIGRNLLMLMLVVIWVADSAAFFGGKRWGRIRLAPRISPAKTWEGVLSACGAVTLIIGIGAYVAGLPLQGAVALWLASLVTVAFSIAGDLFESLLKRHAGVKDSGALLPGHGGVLDRIDGIIAAAPIFLLGVTIFQPLS